MTAQELLRYRNEPYRQEVVGGRLHEMEPPGAEHGAVAMRISMLLAVHVQARNLGFAFAGEIGFQLASDPDTVRAPDAGFIARARVEETGIPRGYWPGPPDLAVEVLSPNDRFSGVESKAFEWLAAGTGAVVWASRGALLRPISISSVRVRNTLFAIRKRKQRRALKSYCSALNRSPHKT